MTFIKSISLEELKNPPTKQAVDKSNTRKSWSYGYNEKHDVVIISKDGTIGDIIEVMGLRIALPKKPVSTDILFNEERNKEKQCWRRNPPIDFDKSFAHKYSDYIEKEYERRMNGVFFYNNGTPVYLTGDHYYMLQYCKVDGIFADFRYPQAVLAYFWEACKADKRCYGMVYLKSRRIGFTTFAYCSILNEMTLNSDKLAGIISKTNSDAESAFKKLTSAFRSLPRFMQPLIAGTDNPAKELVLDQPAKKITKNNQEVSRSIGLNSRINYKATALNSYDSERLFRILLDEGAKFPKEVSFKQYWSVVKTTLELGTSIVGKAIVGSTMNSLEDGGKEFKEVYQNSKLIGNGVVGGRKDGGRTATGLYAIFIPSEEIIEGCFNKYGYIVKEDVPYVNEYGEKKTEGSIKFIENKFKAVSGDKVLLYEEIRKFPRNEEEAFRDSAYESIFDVVKIDEQLEHINVLRGTGSFDVTIGDFMWHNGIRDSKVVWYPNKNGRFHVSWLPNDKYNNKYYVKGVHRFPANERIGAGGCDPYDIDRTVDGKGSNGAFHIKTRHVLDSDIPSDYFVLEYIDRPEHAVEFFEDVLKACVFYGVQVLVESNKAGIINYFKERGYEGYLMKRPKKLMSVNKRYANRGVEFGVPATKESNIIHAESLQFWIVSNVGYKEDGTGGRILFERTLYDWRSFKFETRTERDATVSSGLAIMACDSTFRQEITKKKLPMLFSGKVTRSR